MSDKLPVDPKRTGVKASLIPFGEPHTFYVGHRLHGPSGAFLDRNPLGPSDWILCCPGCGEAGGPRRGASWTVTQGSFADVTTLTLSPSILCQGCCGWHGYLKNGVFESC